MHHLGDRSIGRPPSVVKNATVVTIPAWPETLLLPSATLAAIQYKPNFWHLSHAARTAAGRGCPSMQPYKIAHRLASQARLCCRWRGSQLPSAIKLPDLASRLRNVGYPITPRQFWVEYLHMRSRLQAFPDVMPGFIAMRQCARGSRHPASVRTPAFFPHTSSVTLNAGVVLAKISKTIPRDLPAERMCLTLSEFRKMPDAQPEHSEVSHTRSGSMLGSHRRSRTYGVAHVIPEEPGAQLEGCCKSVS